MRGIDTNIGDTVALANHDCELIIGVVLELYEDKLTINVTRGTDISTAFYDEIVVLKPLERSEKV